MKCCIAVLVAGIVACAATIEDDIKPSLRRGRVNRASGRVNRASGRPVFLNDTCTAAVMDVQPFEGEQGHGDEYLACEIPSGLMYQIPSVSPEWIAEKTATGELKSGETQLDLPPRVAMDVARGQLQVSGPLRLINKPGLVNRQRKLQAVGTRSVLVVNVITADATTDFSEAVFSSRVFGGNGDTVNLKSQYQECSHNKLNFIKAADQSGSPNSISNGVTTVTVTASTADTTTAVQNAVTNALRAQFGVSSPRFLADHVMYCMPAGVLDGIAFAFINSWLSVYSNEWCISVSAQMHELGHNLNLAHSNEGGIEYRDQSGMMGLSYRTQDAPKMCFNAAKLWQLGWFFDQSMTVSPLVDGSTQGIQLASFLDYRAVPANPILVKINTPSSTDYYMTLNARHGFNSGTREGGNQVVIVRTGAEGAGFSPSSLVAKLSAGGTYTIPDFGGSGVEVVVTVNSLISTSSSRMASVDIVFAEPTSSPTAHPTAPPTAQPTDEPTAPPTSSPTSIPSASPTTTVSVPPTAQPTDEPTPPPTSSPTSIPSASPTTTVSAPPTAQPTDEPTTPPSSAPSIKPTATPTNLPTAAPTDSPTDIPTATPTDAPTAAPTDSPTDVPTTAPTHSPTGDPTSAPTLFPTSPPPTDAPVASCLGNSARCHAGSQCCTGDCICLGGPRRCRCT